jgi:beta-lactamase family protein
MRRAARFRARSIAKPFVSVVVLQLAERGRLSLDARLPEVLPADVVGRFPTAADITVRMLLGNRSGIPEWNTPALDEQVARDPAKVWKVSEFLDLAAAQPPVFAPGAGFFYSSTNYNLLGLGGQVRAGQAQWADDPSRHCAAPRAAGDPLDDQEKAEASPLAVAGSVTAGPQYRRLRLEGRGGKLEQRSTGKETHEHRPFRARGWHWRRRDCGGGRGRACGSVRNCVDAGPSNP